MDNDQFILSVRDRINKRKKRTTTLFYSISSVAILIILLLINPITFNSTIDNTYYSAEDSTINEEYILNEADILLYLIDELDVEEFLSISIDRDLFEDFNALKEEI